MKLSFAALLSSVSSKADRTCKVVLNTQELGADAGELMNLSGQQLSVLFVSGDEPIIAEDIPEPPSDDEARMGKSPSQRQRALLYHIWMAKGKPGKSFELYYSVREEQINNSLSEELNKLN